MESIISKDVLSRLTDQGYAVIENVLSTDECDEYIDQYKAWYSTFDTTNNKPVKWSGLIHQFRVAYAEPTWKVRLKTKPYFARIWETEKLLTSMDGISISEPPEKSGGEYRDPKFYWYHMDQGRYRKGLHAYQGAVYLEETTEEDYCFRVWPGSAKYHRDFIDAFPEAASDCDFFRLESEHLEWYRDRGVSEKSVPVPKGGMVLWDSRTLHDNSKPVKGRKTADVWRYVIFVCMTPAIWAEERDLKVKRRAFEKMAATAHWASQTTRLFATTDELDLSKDIGFHEMIDSHPDIAKTKEVRQLVGLDSYDFNDGNPNDPGWRPSWTSKDAYKKLNLEDFF